MPLIVDFNIVTWSLFLIIETVRVAREEMEKLEKGMLEAQKEKVIDYLVTALL